MTENVPVSLLFNFADASEADRAAQIIEQRLNSHGVLRARAMRLHPRLTGAEVAACVLVTVTIIRETRTAVAELRKLVSEIKGLAADFQPSLASAYADIGSRRINAENLVAEDLQAPHHRRRGTVKRLRRTVDRPAGAVQAVEAEFDAPSRTQLRPS